MQKIPTAFIILSGLMLIVLCFTVYWYFWMKPPSAPAEPVLQLPTGELSPEQIVEQQAEIIESLRNATTTTELSIEEKSAILDSLVSASSSESALSEEEKIIF